MSWSCPHGRGSEIYIRDCEELEGHGFAIAAQSFPRAVLLGIVRPEGSSFEPLLNPPPDMVLGAGDRLALLAHSYDGSTPLSVQPPAPPPTVQRIASRRVAGSVRVLVLGWSHKVPALLAEFDSYRDESFHVHVISTNAHCRARSGIATLRFRTRTRHPRTGRGRLHHAFRAAGRGGDELRRIVLLGSDRLGSGEESTHAPSWPTCCCANCCRIRAGRTSSLSCSMPEMLRCSESAAAK